MGITKIGPNLYFLKARCKANGDKRAQELFRGPKPDAEARYLELRALVRKERVAGTFGDLLERYREGRGEIPRGQRCIYQTLTRDLGAVPLEGLAGALEAYAKLLRGQKSPRTGKVLANSSINRHRAMVAASLTLARDKGVPGIPRLSKAIWPKLPEVARDRLLDPLEAHRLENVLEAEAPHLLPLFRFASLVPCRKSELVRMRREDLDLFNEAIRVHNGTTKNDEGSWKPIPAPLVPYFRAIPSECPWLFYRVRAGKYLPLGDFKKAWGRCLRLAGVRNFRFHDTRASAATGLADAGTPERAIMKVAGWRTNMLSTYHRSRSKNALKLVRFSVESGNPGATSGKDAGKNGDLSGERAVS